MADGLGCDEEPSPDMQQEIVARAISGNEKYHGFRVPYSNYFLGRLLRHGDPLYKLILFKWTGARYESREIPGMQSYDLEMHCHPILPGPTGTFRSRMIHRDCENLHHYFERHNTYS